jgi:hypothetical protein
MSRRHRNRDGDGRIIFNGAGRRTTMKKNLNALLLLGIALTLGTGYTVRAGHIEREATNPEGVSFKSSRQNHLRRERRERTSKQVYAAAAARDQRDGALAAYRKDDEARGFISDLRLREKDDTDSIRAHNEIAARARDVGDHEYFANRSRGPDKERIESEDGKVRDEVRGDPSRPERQS